MVEQRLDTTFRALADLLVELTESRSEIEETLDEAPGLFQLATLYAIAVWLIDGTFISHISERRVLLVIWVLSWIIAPLVTRYMAMKVGRSREFLADAMSAQFTRNPAALADALDKISSSTVKPTAIPRSSAQLCIVDPFHSTWGDRQGRFADLMATHPPLRDRIARLRAMAYQPDSQQLAKT